MLWNIFYSIDDKILLHEPPQLARWDEESEHWKTSEITDIRYEPGNGDLPFN